ncbi:Mu transposase C-terminal domain-containing protein [Thalassobaculum sp.]|uniref:Mu transposase C-terminal domain-containing protein n=1 Tax=Thalassobaculum sp. TaxID=2022740 RepID=UPI0032EDF74B
MAARLALLAEVDRLAPAVGLMRARDAVARAADEGRLPIELQALVTVANQRGGKSGARSLTASSLRRWDDTRNREGDLALAPQPAVREQVLPPAWMVSFMRYYATPTKRSIADCWEEAVEAGVELPALRTVQLAVQKLPPFIRNRGRMGPRDIKKLKAFVRRDTSGMEPGEVFTADGHSLHAKVAHPVHGKPFRPEITTVIDVATRRACGWSIDLSENTWAVADALRHACERSTTPLIWYVDRGSGFNNGQMDDPLTGLLARLGITKSNSLPYNSQARGLSERSHQSICVRAARRLPTYLGRDMDTQAHRAISKEIERDLEDSGGSDMLPSWPEFLDIAEFEIEAYNARPHSGLPKITDPDTGRRRHMSPNEAWAAAIAAGWTADPVTGSQAEDLFRPHVRRTVVRGEVKLFGNRYFLEGLDLAHGHEVLVGFDLRDASKVWVRTLEGQLIGIATFEGNAVSYFPRSALEQARERRMRGRLGRNEARRSAIEAELQPAAIDIQPAPTANTHQIADGEAAFERLQASSEQRSGAGAMVVTMGSRPHFSDDYTFARWCMDNPDELVASDLAVLKGCLKTQTGRMYLEAYQRITPTELGAFITEQERRVAEQ